MFLSVIKPQGLYFITSLNSATVEEVLWHRTAASTRNLEASFPLQFSLSGFMKEPLNGYILFLSRLCTLKISLTHDDLLS